MSTKWFSKKENKTKEIAVTHSQDQNEMKETLDLVISSFDKEEKNFGWANRFDLFLKEKHFELEEFSATLENHELLESLIKTKEEILSKQTHNTTSTTTHKKNISAKKALSNLELELSSSLEIHVDDSYVNKYKEIEQKTYEFPQDTLNKLPSYGKFISLKENVLTIEMALAFDRDIDLIKTLPHDQDFSNKVDKLTKTLSQNPEIETYFKNKDDYHKLVQEKILFDNKDTLEQYKFFINKYQNAGSLTDFDISDLNPIKELQQKVVSFPINLDEVIPSFSENWRAVLHSFDVFFDLINERLNEINGMKRDDVFLSRFEDIKAIIKDPSLLDKDNSSLYSALLMETNSLSIAFDLDNRIKKIPQPLTEDSIEEIKRINRLLTKESEPYLTEKDMLKELNYQLIYLENKDTIVAFDSFLETFLLSKQTKEEDYPLFYKLSNELEELRFDINDYIKNFNSCWCKISDLFFDQCNDFDLALTHLEKGKRNLYWIHTIQHLEKKTQDNQSNINEEQLVRLNSMIEEIPLVKKAFQLQDLITRLDFEKRDDEFLQKFNAIKEQLDEPYARYLTDRSKLSSYEKDAIGIQNKVKINQYRKILSTFEHAQSIDDYKVDDILSFKALDKDLSLLSFDLTDYIDEFNTRWIKIKDGLINLPHLLDQKILALLNYNHSYQIIAESEILKEKISLLNDEERKQVQNLSRLDELDHLVLQATIAKTDDDQMNGYITASTKNKSWANEVLQFALSLKEKSEDEKKYFKHDQAFQRLLPQAIKLDKEIELDLATRLLDNEASIKRGVFDLNTYQNYTLVRKNLFDLFDIDYNALLPGYDEKWPTIKAAFDEYEEKQKQNLKQDNDHPLKETSKGSYLFSSLYGGIILLLLIIGTILLQLFNLKSYVPYSLGFSIAQGTLLLGFLGNVKRKPFLYTFLHLVTLGVSCYFFTSSFNIELAIGLTSGLAFLNVPVFFLKKKLNIPLFESFTSFVFALVSATCFAFLKFLPEFNFVSHVTAILLILLYLIVTLIECKDCYFYFYILNAFLLAGSSVVHHFYPNETIIVYALLISSFLGTLFPIFKKQHPLICSLLGLSEISIGVIYLLYLQYGLSFIKIFLPYLTIGFGTLYFIIWLILYLRKPLLKKSYAICSHLFCSLAAFSYVFIPDLIYYGIGLAGMIFLLNFIGLFIHNKTYQKTTSVTFDEVLLSSTIALAVTIIDVLCLFFTYDQNFLFYVAGSLLISGIYFLFAKSKVKQLTTYYKNIFTSLILLFLFVPMLFIWFDSTLFFGWASVAFVLLLIHTFGQINEAKLSRIISLDVIIVVYFAAYYILKFTVLH